MYQDSIHANDVDWDPARLAGVYLKVLHGSPDLKTSVKGCIALTVFPAGLDVHVVD
jgi:hypothetical protein